MGIPVLRHDEKKPGGVAEVLAFFEGKGSEGEPVGLAATLLMLPWSVHVAFWLNACVLSIKKKRCPERCGVLTNRRTRYGFCFVSALAVCACPVFVLCTSLGCFCAPSEVDCVLLCAPCLGRRDLIASCCVKRYNIPLSGWKCKDRWYSHQYITILKKNPARVVPSRYQL